MRCRTHPLPLPPSRFASAKREGCRRGPPRPQFWGSQNNSFTLSASGRAGEGFPLLFLLLLLLSGCAKHGPGLPGTWSGVVPLPGGGTTPSRLTLNPGGTFLSESEGRGSGGTYTVEDNILSETYTLYVSNGVTHALPPDAPRHTERFGFRLNGDTLTLTPQDGGTPVTLSRAKP